MHGIRVIGGKLEATRYPDVSGVRFALVPDADCYCVGDDGSWWSRKERVPGLPGNKWRMGCEWRQLRPGESTSGYWLVRYSTNQGRWKTAPLHRLVLLAFVGPCPEGHEAAHDDGNRKNARLTNLAWKTKASNTADKYRHGTHLTGSRVGNAKLDTATIERVFLLRRQGLSLTAIGRMVGIPNQSVSRVLGGKRYSDEVRQVITSLTRRGLL
jgi:hypothetical protein